MPEKTFLIIDLKEEVGGGGKLPYNKLMGMYHWMGSHCHDWIDYNVVVCSKELLGWSTTFFTLRRFWQEIFNLLL